MSLLDFKALHEFRSAWDKFDESEGGRTGRFKVWAKIAYHSPKGTVTDRSLVTILFGGYDEGTIDIDETDDLTLDDYHLRFTEKFQDYVFDEDSDTLVIEGSSPKMGGEYMVRIHPTER